jgi:hypothetical protein
MNSTSPMMGAKKSRHQSFKAAFRSAEVFMRAHRGVWIIAP